jgi:hypothetical protein
MTAAPSPAALVDLARYPIADLSAPAARDLVQRSRATLEADSVLMLHDFVTPAAREAMVGELLAALPQAYRRQDSLTVYYEGETRPPEGHGALAPNPSRQTIFAGDQFAREGALWSLFLWDGLTDFVAAIVGGGALYRSADPLASLTATAIGDGDQHAWHFDQNDFVVSLLLQEPDEGGRFEMIPGAKADDSRIDHAVVARALAGREESVIRPPMRAGTFSVFRGRRALHRVSPARGWRQRLIALFSYDRKPGMMFTPEVYRVAFGRVA